MQRVIDEANGQYAVTIAPAGAALTLDSGTLTGSGGQLTLQQPAALDGGSGGSDGSSGSDTYAVTVQAAVNGSVTVSRRSALRGATITITATPNGGFVTADVTVTGRSGEKLLLTEQGGGRYTFTMPASDVTVKAAFVSEGYKPEACSGDDTCPSRAFTDLDDGKWYHDAVNFVIGNNLMHGVGRGLFAPDDRMSRAMLCQILCDKAGRPAVSGESIFSDVAKGVWYTDAIIRANENAIAEGYGGGLYGPDDRITREQFAAIPWRYAGSPSSSHSLGHFTDAEQISGYAQTALAWANENSIVNGKGEGILDPQGNATRAEAAQMLMNFYSKFAQ